MSVICLAFQKKTKEVNLLEFRNLKKQYEVLKAEIDSGIQAVCQNANFISGAPVKQLEKELAEYVGVKHCITCANGTDALTLALMVMGVCEGDCVFVPDFTFFSTAETVSYEGATPIFIDVDPDTFNMNPESLRTAVEFIKKEGKLNPKAVVTVDLFGLPADYDAILGIAKENGLLVLEDSAQGFGSNIRGSMACSFADIATTSFFPAKPLGCYGDGGAIFTDNDDYAALLRSYAVHGKNADDKYDNLRVGMNSRLDTIQAAVLLPKFHAFRDYELCDVNKAADYYTENLKGLVKTPTVPEGYYSSWAQYTILLKTKEERDNLKNYLADKGIPTMVYYQKMMSQQTAMEKHLPFQPFECTDAKTLCSTCLSLPIGPYITRDEQNSVIDAIKEFLQV